MNKRLVFALAVLCLVSQAFAVSLNLESLIVSKGGSISGYGDCSESVLLEGKVNGNELFSRSIACAGGVFSFSQPVSFLVPSGYMDITVSENDDLDSETVRVNPTRESAFLSLTVLSPTVREISRSESITLSIQVLDAGQPVESATVKTWDFEHNEVLLEKTAPGIFTATVLVPLNADAGEWSLPIVAESSRNDERIGGERVLPVSIVPADFLVSLEQPAEASLSILQPVLFRARLQYPSGAPVEQAVVQLVVNEQPVEMAARGNGFFEASHLFSENDAGTQRVSLSAEDAFGNTGSFSRDFFVASDVRASLLNWLPVLLVIIVLLFLVNSFIVPRIRGRKNIQFLQARKTEIESELVRLQQQYFEQNAISKPVFSEKTAALNKELADVNKKLNTSDR